MSFKISVGLFWFVLIIWIRLSNTYNSNDVKTLMTNMFTGYYNTVRPIDPQETVVSISVDFFLNGINEYDDDNNKLTTTAYLKIIWNDNALSSSWTPASVPEVIVAQTAVWLPDITLLNGFNALAGLGSSRLYVTITKTGSSVTWIPLETFESQCRLDPTFFPWDKTKCDIKFLIWSNTNDKVKASIGSDGVNKTYYSENSEWALVSTSASTFTMNNHSGVTFSLTLKRKPFYHILTIVIPIILLALMNIFVFLLPGSSREKMTYVATVFLAYALFMTIASQVIPKNSTKVSIMGVHILFVMFVSTIVTILTVLQLRFFHRPPQIPIPGCLRGFVKCTIKLQCRDCCVTHEHVNVIWGGDTKRASKHDVQWPDVADALDFLFFWVFFLFVGVVTMACVVACGTGALL
ncbi:hypothetical protein ACJMK2_006083 [Sinanodonta woodiana]|uniref:Uncharacterized protein n=1 Tax=Sinanodonta woodiana TaxID=1069815 RepID=A0ABD3VS14_SINWO